MQPKHNQSPSGGSGYGKRPLWQWVLIYIVAAVVVYGIAFIVYKQFIQDNSSTSGTGSSSLY